MTNDRASRRRRERANTIKGARTGTPFKFDKDAETAAKRAAGGSTSGSADPKWLANSLDHLFVEFNRLPPARPIDALMLGCNFYKALIVTIAAELSDHESDLLWMLAVDTFAFAAENRGKPPPGKGT